ncbi:MAG: putative phage abortive infection protein [Chitinophagales bacterium]|nr:putative phage abortive infection protein [Chitinophagales bacterium]
MSNKEPEEKLDGLYKLIALVVLLWFISWWVVDNLNTSGQDRGTFGDKFGFINSLFSGLALAGIIYSIILQKRELALQRMELKDTRDEFKQQNFESTFFNLLKNQQDITNGIKATLASLKYLTTTDIKEVRGREFFVYSRRELIRINQSLNYKAHAIYDQDYYESIAGQETDYHTEEENLSEAKIEYVNFLYSIKKEKWEKMKTLTPIDKVRLIYGIYFSRYHFVLGHYFRHLYHILLFLEDNEKAELNVAEDSDKQGILDKYASYAQFVQAQMSGPEMLLLFYNSLSFPKLKRLVIKYNTLENLSVEDLIEPAHNCVPEIKLKSRATLLEL